jgi:S-methylmethionine-dependent homocysteine/selenocysteine methylase
MPIPVPGGRPFVTDAGIETVLLFLGGFELPEFAAFPLLEDERGLEAFNAYYRDFADIANVAGASLLLTTPTWRANSDWANKIGYDTRSLDRVNQSAIAFMRDLQSTLGIGETSTVVGIVGPRGDGYVAGDVPDIAEADEYHRPQIESFANAGADMVQCMTITSANEAGGILRAANSAGIPVAIQLTVEVDGRLPDGSSLKTAVERLDSIGEVAWFGINCAYPDHMLNALTEGAWLNRIGEIRPNASSKSHAELDEATELDRGEIDDLVRGVEKVRTLLPNLNIVGGCCGSDREHIARLWGVA